MGMIGLPKPLLNNNKIDEIILRNIFENVKIGIYPNTGVPETRCSECMFYGVTCLPSPEYAGCYGGWKMIKE